MSHKVLKIYNTLTRRKEIFKPIRQDRVGLYTCGPTVYNFVHIGNLRTFIFQDVLKKALRLAGYRVRHIMNTTDVDDKTIKGAREAKEDLIEFTRRYEEVFRADLKKLNIQPPNTLARATEHIPAMIKLIQRLLVRGIAYKKEGSVYFSVNKFKDYGKLARLDKKGLKIGVRIDVDEYSKDQVQDFVLWKGKKNGEPFWRAPFGEGRPGWHIECSAMSMKYLGETFDLHTAGVDLIFPHHENEIAQSEAATGKKFVRYWMHGEHLLVDNQKMSKSLHNFYTLRDIENKFNPLAFRYLIMGSHYRSKLNFTWESMDAGQRSLERIYGFVGNLISSQAPTTIIAQKSLAKYEKDFAKAILDNLDTPKALAVFWKLIRDYRKTPANFRPKGVLRLIYDFDRVLGLGLRDAKPKDIPAQIQELVRRREEYRKKGLWKEADTVRERVAALGYGIEDTQSGPKVVPKTS